METAQCLHQIQDFGCRYSIASDLILLDDNLQHGLPSHLFNIDVGVPVDRFQDTFYLRGFVDQNIEVVAEKWGAELTDERARKAIDFSIEYSSPQRSKLIERCQKKRFCPEIGTMIRLLPLAPRERNKLLTLVLNNRWTRVDLDAEIERRKPADNSDGHKRRGRLPKAAKSIQALAGKANINAREYSHVLEVLGEEDANYKLSSRRKKELETLIELLRKIGKWV